MLNKLFLIILSLALFGCSSLDGLFSDSEIKSTVDGERISVLKIGSSTRVDPTLSNVPVLVPEAKNNIKWYKSDGHDSNVPENIRAPEYLDNKDIVRIGSSRLGGSHMGATPIIADGLLFTIDSVGLVRAFSAFNTRERVWTYEIDDEQNEGGFASAGMLYHNGRIFITTGHNKVISLDAKEGKLIWRRTINSVARSAPAAMNNIVFINTVNNKLYALNANDGAIEWTHSGVAEDISVFGAASPAAFGNIVFAPYSSGEIYALNLADGSEIWSQDLTLSNTNVSLPLADIDASPVVDDGVIYAISNDGILSAMDIYSGKRIWEQEISGNKTPWIAGDFIYLLGSENEIICVYKKTGGVKWIKKLPSYKKEENKSGPITWNGPVMAGNTLLVVGSHGRLLSLAPGSGEVLFRNKVPKHINLPPVVAYDSVFLLSDKALLVSLRGNINSLSGDSVKDGIGRHRPTIVRRAYGRMIGKGDAADIGDDRVE